jgi:tRNA(fMet)-specific endonuclease VapC
VFRHFDRIRQGEAAISVITYGELLYDANKSGQRQASLDVLREFFQLVPALPLQEKAGEVYGLIRAELESRGEEIGTNDLWIAAHALASGLTLCTNDENEFRRVRGLKVHNWAV